MEKKQFSVIVGAGSCPYWLVSPLGVVVATFNSKDRAEISAAVCNATRTWVF